LKPPLIGGGLDLILPVAMFILGGVPDVIDIVTHSDPGAGHKHLGDGGEGRLLQGMVKAGMVWDLGSGKKTT